MHILNVSNGFSECAAELPNAMWLKVTYKVSDVDDLAIYAVCCRKANTFRFQIDAFTFRR